VRPAARIRILRGSHARTIDVAPGIVTIGRASTAIVRIAEEDVAPEHAVLQLPEAGEWSVTAAGGPLAVDGIAVARGGRASISRGCKLAIAGWTLVLDDPPTDSQIAGPMRTASLARELVRDLLGGEVQVGPTVVIEGGPGAGRTIVLPPAPSRVVIGRGEESDVVVLDADLSRRHLAFEREDANEAVRVLDLGSKNGTRIGTLDVGEEGRFLRAGDVVSAGRTVFRLQDPAEEYLRALDRRTATPETRLLAPAPPVVVPAPPPRASLAPVVVAASIAIAAVVALILLLV
jgi:pSer/pThr/pTyr-binding forkhead associated (FHA) protein